MKPPDQLAWKIFYEDGSTFASSRGKPWDAPPSGAVVLAQEDPTDSLQHTVFQGKDYFFWRPDVGWCPADFCGMLDYLMQYRGPKAVLFGRSIHDKTYWALVDRAIKLGIRG